MKKFILFLIVVAKFSINLNAQYVGFEPNEGQVFVCPGTDPLKTVYIYWSCQETKYPPDYSVASYVELTAEGKTYKSNWHNTDVGDNIPITMMLSSGIHTWTLKLYELFLGYENFQLTAQATHTFFVKYKINIANNFNGGIINVDGSTVPSGSHVLKLVGENISVGAIDQNDGAGYDRIWNASGTNNSYWQINNTHISGATSRNYSYTVASNDNGATLVADLKRICNITFQNNFIGVGNGGVITVNGSQYNSPTSSFQVVEQNPITAEANTYYYNNGIIYTFKQWNDGNTSYNRTFNPSENTTYTAQFQGKPENEFISFGNAVGEPIVINWTDNPNTNVTQYQIWRKVKHNGVMGAATLIATVNRGVQTYTDYEYTLTNSYSHDLLLYDVRAYYSTEGTYSDEDYSSVYGQISPTNKEEKNTISVEKEIPKEFSISNYPNPFNPTTIIKYSLPKSGYVTLKVYDILGREVATLVNEYQKSGTYSTEFRTKSSELSSGIYVYTINYNGQTLTRKMILTK